jgi:hypothetical protein
LSVMNYAHRIELFLLECVDDDNIQNLGRF